MKRRDFIRNVSLATSSLISFPAFAKGQNYQLVTIRGGSPGSMLELGLEALGGIEKFVQKGQKVLIKPTLGWERSPEQAANTNPKLLARLVELCYKAGSSGVYLVDQTHDQWTKAYKASGIERAVKDASAKILPGNKESLYHEVSIPNGRLLKKAKLHQIVDEVDVIINAPVLKVNDSHIITGALDNLKGLMWDTKNYSEEDQSQCLLDLLQYKKPILNIIDAYRVITKNGPAGKNKEDVKIFRSQILSTDIVAADAYAARRLGIDPEQINLLQQARKQGFGQIELPHIQVKDIILKQQAFSK